MNKIREVNGLVESSYLFAFTVASNFAKFLIERGGIYTLPLMPVLELVKARLYWDKSSQPDFKDRLANPLKITLNRGFNAFKVVGFAVAVGVVLAGMMALGFGLMIGITYLNTARALYKAVRSGLDGERKKVANNLHKAAVSGAIATGFLLMSFFPPLAPIGMFLVLITSGHLILSLFPSVLAEIIPEKQTLKLKGEPARNEDPESSGVKKTFLPSQTRAEAEPGFSDSLTNKPKIE